MFNTDCMQYMRDLPDKAYELAIVDPPYGGGQHFNFRFGVDEQVYDSRKPEPEYWEQLFRISANQIVWGGNYFTASLPENRCWISWYKGNPVDAFSDFELAWTSFDKVSKALKLISYGFNHPDKKRTGQSTIHPTQKPVALYKWLLKNYASPGDRILDTHGGSMSHAIAAYDMGFDLDIIELDPDYFKAAKERYEAHVAKYAPAGEVAVNKQGQVKLF